MKMVEPFEKKESKKEEYPVEPKVSAGSVLAMGLALSIFFLLVNAFVLNIAWAALVPSILPGLVQNGTIAKTISYNTCILLALVYSYFKTPLSFKRDRS